MDKLLTRKNIAERLQCSIRQVHRLQLPAPLRFGRLVRWRLEDVDNWISAQRSPGGSGRPRNSGKAKGV